MNSLFTKILIIVRKYKKIIENFSYLSLIQIFNMVLPLVTYPYLIRVLGTELMGLVLFSQVVMSYFSSFIGFGFRMTATKKVSINRNDIKKLSIIVSNVQYIKLIIFVLSFITLLILVNIVPIFMANKLLYLLAFLLCFNELLFPQYFFQGIEKMKYITIINLLSRVIFIILIFVFVNSSDDYIYVVLLNGIGVIIGGLVAQFIMFSVEGIRITKPDIVEIKALIKETIYVVGFDFFGIIKTQSNSIILGIFFGYSSVTFYDLANKVTSVFSAIFMNFSRAVFPHLSKSKDLNFAKKAILLILALSISMYLILIILNNSIFNIIAGKVMEESVNLFYILGLLIPIYAIADVYNAILISFNKNKVYLLSTVVSTAFYLFLLLLFIYFFDISIYLVAVILVLSQILSMIIKYNYVQKIFKNF